MKSYFLLFLFFFLFKLDARAVGANDSYNIVGSKAASIEIFGLSKVQMDTLEVSASEGVRPSFLASPREVYVNDGRVPNTDAGIAANYILDLEAHPNYWGDLANTRVTNVYSLEDIVEFILRFKRESPDSKPWAVFDVDEMLLMTHTKTIKADAHKYAIHPNTNELLKKLKENQIPIILLSTGTETRTKFLEAGIQFDGVVDTLMDKKTLNVSLMDKGDVLVKYIATLPDKDKPTHIFHSDDKDSNLQDIEVFLGALDGVDYTTFHFWGFKVMQYLYRSIVLDSPNEKVTDPYLQREAKRRNIDLAEYKRMLREEWGAVYKAAL